MDERILLLIVIIALITFFTRAFPFIFSGSKKLSSVIPYLENNIPPMIMLLLVIYCLKDITITKKPYGLPEIISVAVVAFFHIWKKNILLSIISGTTCYILLHHYLF